MLPEDPWNSWWIKVIAFCLLSAIGGSLGYLMRTIDSRKKIKWQRVLLEGAAAGFVGLIIMLLCLAAGLSYQWTGVVVGVSGWLGASATIRLIELHVFKKLGLDKIQDAVEPSNDKSTD